MKLLQLKAKITSAIIVLLLAAVSAVRADTATNVINTFDTAASGTGEEWGSGAVAWDGSQGNGAGALAVTLTFTNGSDTPMVAYMCLNGGNPWYQPTTMNLSSYDFIEFDIKWDNTSDITISQFNDLGTWPLNLTNSSGATVFQNWASAGYLSGSTAGIEIELCGGPAGQLGPTIMMTNIPDAAASGWTHVKVPINKSQSEIDGVNGIVFHKWIHQQWGLNNSAVARFWVDNVMVTGTIAPPPPPIMIPVRKATPGLNVFCSTAGSLYDRQSAVLRQTSGLSWVGHASTANPVTYSFTIADYPSSTDCEAWMFLVPNPPSYMDNAPDWNGTNVAIVYLQGSKNSAVMHFQYKVNEDHQQAMYSGGTDGGRGISYTNPPGSWNGVTANYYESGNLAIVTNNGILGTWTLKFTSDTNGSIIAPNGNTTSFVFPPYNVGVFAESSTPGFYLYLGMQANNTNAYNQSTVFADFAVSNTASPYSENFLVDPVLDTTNIWATSAASGPRGVVIAPVGSLYWVDWTLPDSGFSLQDAATLGNSLGWSAPTAGPLVPLVGIRSQLVLSNEVPAGATAFFQLIKRQFTQLQVLLPGETNAPNTLSGKAGTPTTAAVSSQVDVTINAVDSTFHIVNSGDTLNVISTDGSATIATPNPVLVGGTVTVPIYFNTAGSWTVTATNSTTVTIPPATSSAITVQ